MIDDPQVICEVCKATMGPCFCVLAEWEEEDQEPYDSSFADNADDDFWERGM
jgi:hypothetical protein